MKTALLHYWLTNMRGGEAVLEQFCQLWPDADIFTHAHDQKSVSDIINEHTISTTFINSLPGAKSNCQQYLPLMPHALKSLDLSGYDLIVSSESGPIKGIRKPQDCTHVCYCHTPMRYVWDMYEDYRRNASIPVKVAMSLFKNYLRGYDLRSADSVDHFIANSNFVAQRIKRIYDRESTVIHPPVSTDFYSRCNRDEKGYYLFVGHLTNYKRPDLAIDACTKMDRPLVVVGDGHLGTALRKKAGGNVTFVGRTDREELRELYAGAKALLFPGIEDFGIVPLEAQAAGTPIIAFRGGGALETVVEDRTGLFFGKPNMQSLAAIIEEFESREGTFVLDALRSNAAKFSEANFRKQSRSFFDQIQSPR